MDVNRYELVAVVHSEGVTDELRDDGGSSRPRFDDTLLVRLVQNLYLLLKLGVNMRTLFNRSAHTLLSSFHDVFV